jgi:hypothetical protein
MIMTMRTLSDGARRGAWLILAAGLTACGGGGGGDGPPAVSLVAITTANGDAVSRAAAAGTLTLSGTAAVPVSAAAAPGGPRSRLALGSGARGGSWAAQVVAGLRSGRAPLKGPLAVIGPETENCPAGGTLSVTLDDRDDNGVESVGDVLTFVFDDCGDGFGDSVDGTVEATLVALEPDLTALTLDVRLRNLTAVSAGWTITADGRLRMSYSTPSLSSLQETYEFIAVGPVRTTVITQAPFSDSGTLADGWHEVVFYDGAVPPVAGNFEFGQGTLRVNGTLTSTQAGGAMVVSTPTPFVSYGEDPYPRTGVMQVQGQGSALRVTALSTELVLIEIDANGDGVYESARTQRWDWLI